MIATIAKAAVRHVLRAQRTSTLEHTDLVHYAVNFIRPCFCAPKQVLIDLQEVNATSKSTLLHVAVKQDGKLRLAGYMT